jgi:hypothetical protein
MQGQEQQQKQRRYSVASPFGLRSCLRQSGRPLRGWARRWAEAQLYLRNNSKSNLRNNSKSNLRNNSKSNLRNNSKSNLRSNSKSNLSGWGWFISHPSSPH